MYPVQHAFLKMNSHHFDFQIVDHKHLNESHDSALEHWFQHIEEKGEFLPFDEKYEKYTIPI